MADVWKELGDKVKALAGNWATFTTLGGVGLYLLGYLSLRFHLTVLGIGTDLAVLDERYLFAGAKFLVYLVSSVPIVVLLVLVLVAVIYLPYRILLPAKIRTKVRAFVKSRWERIWTWCSNSTRLALTGVVFSVMMIQLVMRQCFLLSNLLISPELPGPGWLRSLLLNDTSGWGSLYFPGLVAGTALTGGLLVVARGREGQTTVGYLLGGLLTFFVAVQLLLLPVNYGYLIVDKTMPRVARIGNDAIKEGQEAWLVWEGKEGVTYLVRDSKNGKNRRTLVTLPRKDIKKIEITGYDPILRVLFLSKMRPSPLKQEDVKQQ